MALSTAPKIEKKSFEEMQSFEDASVFGQNDQLTRAEIFTKYQHIFDLFIVLLYYEEKYEDNCYGRCQEN